MTKIKIIVLYNRIGFKPNRTPISVNESNREHNHLQKKKIFESKQKQKN